MVLKRIEIYGFKSFADKLAVDFEDGMTGIVGPNGCGKSNVADAIRWVLGEQSARILRGTNMQDLIFGGTTSRKSMSYCEVSMIFDNSKKLFPVDYEEIAITRKLYRNGESEYLINRETARLKDITDMMRNTGIGKEGYSIIGQGQVEAILNSRPIERRGIFEEAAGISRHKAQKNDAERKLSRTQDNLEKLGLIITELSERVEPLRKQSEAAKRFGELRETLKYNEINTYLLQCENHRAEKEKAEDKLRGIAEEYNMREAEYKDTESRYGRKVAAQAEADEETERLYKQQVSIVSRLKTQEGDSQLHAMKLEFNKGEEERIIEEIEDAKDKLAGLNEALAGFNTEKKNLEEQTATAQSEYSKAEAEHQKITDDILKKENEIEAENRALIESMSELADVKVGITELKTRLEAVTERKTETAEAVERMRAELEEAEQAKQAEEKANAGLVAEAGALRGKVGKIITETNEVRQATMTANTELRELSNGIGAVTAKLRYLKDHKENYDLYNSSVKNILQRAKLDRELASKIDSVVAEIIRVPKELEVAIETALGAALQNIITRTEDDAKYVIEYLRREKLGRITFLPMSSARARGTDRELEYMKREQGCLGTASELINYDRKYAEVMSGLLGGTLVFKDFDTAKSAAVKCGYSYRIVTLLGDVFAGRSISGGSRRSDSSELLKMDRDIAETNALYQKYDKKYKEKTAEIQALEDRGFQLERELAQANSALKEKELVLAAYEERLLQAISDIEEKSASMKRLSENLRTFEFQQEEYQRRIDSADKTHEGMVAKRDSKKDGQKSKDVFAVQKQERDAMHSKMTSLRVKMAAFERDMSALMQNFERQNFEAENLKILIQKDEEELVLVRTKITEAERAINDIADVDELAAKNKEITEKTEKLAKYKKELAEEVQRLNIHKEEILRLLSEINERRVKEENSLEKIEANLAARGEYIKEEYGLTYDDALPMRDEAFELTGAITEINRIKREISRLGPVNPGAIEEYKEVSERFEDLSGQVDDLQRAKADLEQLIADISREMLEIFEREFVRINESFKAAFKELFGGGTAELMLIDDESGDPLLAGVEIVAKPPAKVLDKLSLLSGGEKTLTVIAILFAILKVKAAPFCVFDEVEAALDESNAQLVAQYMKKYSKDTQFVVITHKKPTMENADRLYGVTMEEKGVSKMVSVKLSEAVRVAEEEQRKSKGA